ncbi:MAG: ABC transporter permease [Candidatus Eremiobacteraeota bacterium]|nr:ABC transporter permease [Candidatus Eremiobacteraeota bacterium]
MNEFITVYSAEIMRRLKSRAFRIGLIVGILGIVALIQLPQYLNRLGGDAGKSIVLTGEASLTKRAAGLLDKDFKVVGMSTSSAAPTAAFMKSHKNAAASVALARAASGLTVTVYAKDPGNISISQLQRDLLPLNLQVATAMSQAKVNGLLGMKIDVRTVASKFSSAADADAARSVALTLIFFLYLLIIFNSQLILSSVAEEKTSRIAELLVASVQPTALLAGKIASAATLAILQMIIWIAVAAFLGLSGASRAHDSSLVGGLSGLFTSSVISPLEIAAFFVFFVLGYLQLATLFAAAGSLINRTEDIGSVSVPLVIPIVIAFTIAITGLQTPDAGYVVVTSFIPIISPFIMFARIAVSNVPAIQIAASLLINLASVIFIAILAGRVYRVGLLLYGRPPNLRQIWATLRG